MDGLSREQHTLKWIMLEKKSIVNDASESLHLVAMWFVLLFAMDFRKNPEQQKEFNEKLRRYWTPLGMDSPYFW